MASCQGEAVSSIEPWSQAYCLSAVTRLASSSPAIEGSARASATSSSAGVPSVATTPRSAPTLRMCRTSARVSTSQSTGMLCRVR